MQIKAESADRKLVLHLRGELDHHAARPLMLRIARELEYALPLETELDFSGVTFMDSSGIGVIMGRYKRIYMLGGEVCAVHTSERMKKILTMSGVTRIMQIYEEDR